MNPPSHVSKFLYSLLIICIAMLILTATGLFDSTKRSPEKLQQLEVTLRDKSQLNDAEAQNQLGTLLYKRAKENNTSFDEALNLFERAADQGHPYALMNLAVAYKNGRGVSIDNEKAIELYYRSGMSFLSQNDTMNAKDSVYNINRINSIHPLKRDLIDAIKLHEKNEI